LQLLILPLSFKDIPQENVVAPEDSELPSYLNGHAVT